MVQNENEATHFSLVVDMLRPGLESTGHTHRKHSGHILQITYLKHFTNANFSQYLKI